MRCGRTPASTRSTSSAFVLSPHTSRWRPSSQTSHGDDAIPAIHQDRVGPAEGPDRGGDLRHMGLVMRPGVLRVGDQVAGRTVADGERSPPARFRIRTVAHLASFWLGHTGRGYLPSPRPMFHNPADASADVARIRTHKGCSVAGWFVIHGFRRESATESRLFLAHRRSVCADAAAASDGHARQAAGR